MTIRRRLTFGLTVTAAVIWPLAGTITPAAAATYTPLPAHVYAPYYETYLAPNTPSIAATAQAVRRQIHHAGVPPVHRQELLRPGLERQPGPAAVLLRLRHRGAARRGRRRDSFVRRLQRRSRRHRDRRLVHERQPIAADYEQ